MSLFFVYVGFSRKGGRELILFLLVAFIFQLTVFDLNYDYGLFFITNSTGWMAMISTTLQKLTTDIVVKLVFMPLLRSGYAILSLYYAIKMLYQNSPSLQSWVKSNDA
jgi:hypothetical protein